MQTLFGLLLPLGSWVLQGWVRPEQKRLAYHACHSGQTGVQLGSWGVRLPSGCVLEFEKESLNWLPLRR